MTYPCGVCSQTLRLNKSCSSMVVSSGINPTLPLLEWLCALARVPHPVAGESIKSTTGSTVQPRRPNGRSTCSSSTSHLVRLCSCSVLGLAPLGSTWYQPREWSYLTPAGTRRTISRPCLEHFGACSLPQSTAFRGVASCPFRNPGASTCDAPCFCLHVLLVLFATYPARMSGTARQDQLQYTG